MVPLGEALSWAEKCTQQVVASYRDLTFGSATRMVWWRIREKLSYRFRPARLQSFGPIVPLYPRGERQPLFVPLTAVSLRTFFQVWVLRMYATPTTLPNVRTIVDLGANIGLTSRWLLRQYPGARLIAVEPDPSNVVILRHMLGHRGDVDILKACIAARDGRVWLRQSVQSDSHQMTHNPLDGALPVDGVSMPTLMRNFQLDRIDVLKVDIEGAEAELFGDNTQWTSQVRCIVIELHREQMSLEQLQQRLPNFVIFRSRQFSHDRIAVCFNKAGE